MWIFFAALEGIFLFLLYLQRFNGFRHFGIIDMSNGYLLAPTPENDKVTKIKIKAKFIEVDLSTKLLITEFN